MRCLERKFWQHGFQKTMFNTFFCPIFIFFLCFPKMAKVFLKQCRTCAKDFEFSSFQYSWLVHGEILISWKEEVLLNSCIIFFNFVPWQFYANRCCFLFSFFNFHHLNNEEISWLICISLLNQNSAFIGLLFVNLSTLITIPYY